MTGDRKTLVRAAMSIIDAPPLDLAIRATLLAFLLGPNLLGLEWHYKLLFHIVSIVGLLIPALARSAGFWCVVAGMMVIKTLDHWWMQDNHVFLLTWWCITVLIALASTGRFKPLAPAVSFDPDESAQRVAAWNARVLIGISFFFAVVWKGFLSPDYMSGNYFHYTFLTDNRFAPLGTLLCGMQQQDYSHNYAAIGKLTNYTMDVQSIDLRGTPPLRTLAIVVTWWTILIEGVLAVLFLLPAQMRLAKYRNHALLLFAWTTYLAAPVKTFGWTLITLGLAQSPRDDRRIQLCYLLTFPLLLIYEQAPIWQTIIGIVKWISD